MARIEWTANSGQEIVITVESSFELDRQGRRKARGRKVVDITATVDGYDHETIGGLRRVTAPGVVGAIGKIGLTAERYERLQGAIQQCEASCEAHNTALDEHANTLDCITATGKRIDSAMAMGE